MLSIASGNGFIKFLVPASRFAPVGQESYNKFVRRKHVELVLQER
jgi:hypothetical protein